MQCGHGVAILVAAVNLAAVTFLDVLEGQVVILAILVALVVMAVIYKRLGFVRPTRDGQWNSLQRTWWLAIHDGYHTGQINLIKAMYRRSKAKS